MPQESRAASALLQKALLSYSRGSYPGEMWSSKGHLAISVDMYGKSQDSRGRKREPSDGNVGLTAMKRIGRKVG